MKKIFFLISCLLLASFLQAQTVVDDCLIKVGTEEAIGPINMHSFGGQVVGCAFISNQKDPDIFIQSDRWYPEFALYKSQGRDENGIPIFGEKEIISLPGTLAEDTSPTYIFQTEDKKVHLIYFRSDGRRVYYALYNDSQKRFNDVRSVVIPATKTTPNSITAYYGSDNKLHVILGVRNEWDDNFNDDYLSLYGGDGIYRGKLSAVGLYEFSCSGWLEGSPSPLRMISPTEDETLKGFQTLRMVDLGKKSKGHLVAGAYYGAISYYENTGTEGVPMYSQRAYIVDAKSNSIRHPAIWAAPAIYPNSDGQFCDIIASSEGGIFYYKFTGNFTADRKPIYEDPVYVLEKNANLYGGSLIVPSVVDWDKDGVLDIVSGNSQGMILFFKNTGTNTLPKFQPGIALKAEGETIWVQGGYGESNQGPVESRWGYASPTVVDWNEDGYLDIIMGDARSKHSVYMGSSEGLKDEHPIYLDDLELRGTWRCRPGVAKIGDRWAYITMDDDNEIHLYWKVDNYNLEDGRKLLMTNGRPISSTSIKESSGTGRIKFEIVDWDGDGVRDLLLGTSKWMTIPDASGIPNNSSVAARGASVIFLKNVGTEESPVYEHPVALQYNGKPFHFFGHCIGVVATSLGLENQNDMPNLLVGDERGRFYLLDRNKLSNTTPKYVGVDIDVLSMNGISVRKVSRIKIFPNANYYLEDTNGFFSTNQFTQIQFGRKESIDIMAKNDGYIYIATDATILPENMDNWKEVKSTGLAYSNETIQNYVIYSKAVKKGEILSIPQLGLMGTILFSNKISEGCLSDAEIPGITIASHFVKTNDRIDNPSIVGVTDYTYLVSYDIFNEKQGTSKTIIMRTYDRGESWDKVAELDGGKNGTLFMHNNAIYLMGESHSKSDVIILESTDAGMTWNRKGGGIILLGHETTSTPIVKLNGRIWKAVKSTVDNSISFISASKDSDIAMRTSWIKSSSVSFPTTLLNRFEGWNNISTIQTADGNISAISNLISIDGIENKSLLIFVDKEGKTAHIPDNSELTIPGGNKDFTIRYDESTGAYWAVTNSIHEADENLPVLATQIKNYLAVTTSGNLFNWGDPQGILYKEGASTYAFRNADWIFNRNDMLMISSTTWPDCTGNPLSIDNSNYLTFHLISDAKNSFIDIEYSTILGEKYRVYPNPAKYMLTIEGGDYHEKIEYKLIDLSGRLICSGNTFSSDPIDISGYARGTYFLNIEDKEYHKLIFK